MTERNWVVSNKILLQYVHVASPVKSLWGPVTVLLQCKCIKSDPECNLNNFDCFFGIENVPFLSYLILCCKFYIYKCCFQNSTPNFTAFESFLVLKRKIEYGIAYKNEKNCLSIWKSGVLIFNEYFPWCLFLDYYSRYISFKVDCIVRFIFNLYCILLFIIIWLFFFFCDLFQWQ